MKASVIVPAKDSAAYVADCLVGVCHQDGFVLGRDYEMIVVDDGSSDDTAALARSHGAIVHTQPNAGPAAARNQGARMAQGKYLVFTDSDCVPAADWLSHMLQPLEADPTVIGVKGVYTTQEHGLIPRFVQLEYESKYERMRAQESIDFIDTYAAAYRRTVFLANDGFDEIFTKPSVEDQEFSFRLERKGYRLVFQPLAAVRHRHDLSLDEYVSRKAGIGYWKAVMLNWMPDKLFKDSHTPPSQRWQIVLAALLPLLLMIALFQPWAWVGVALGTLGFILSTLPILLFVARRDPPVLLVAPVLVLARTYALGLGLLAGMLHTPPHVRQARKGLNLSERAVKRMVDVVGATLGFVATLPVLLIAMLAIRLDSPGPVIFTQVRAGENGKPFRIFKLRTMTVDAEARLDEVIGGNHLTGPVFKIPNDSRVTRVGHWLRRWSLDELPQLLNILNGEMSLVGPRPEEMRIVAQYNDRQRQRLLVKPGLTGPMQISGRGNLDMEARLAVEMNYVDHYSLWKDLQILFYSVSAVLSGEGAY